jgi:Family of unknown function (DUF6521)
MSTTSLARETRNVQNAALGACLLWRFACGYIAAHKTGDRPPLQLLFVVLPLLLHSTTAQVVKSTHKASGLRAFAAKFSESKAVKQDLLLAIHDRVLRHRGLTLDSVQVALAKHSILIDAEGFILPLSEARAVAGIPDEIRQLMRDAEKVGVWCSQLTLHEVATILKVRF